VCASTTSFILLYSPGTHCDLHSFPTRRSSDLSCSRGTRRRCGRSRDRPRSRGGHAPRRPARSPLTSPTAPSGDRHPDRAARCARLEEHTSELQSRSDLVCRLLLEKKKKKTKQ